MDSLLRCRLFFVVISSLAAGYILHGLPSGIAFRFRPTPADWTPTVDAVFAAGAGGGRGGRDGFLVSRWVTSPILPPFRLFPTTTSSRSSSTEGLALESRECPPGARSSLTRRSGTFWSTSEASRCRDHSRSPPEARASVVRPTLLYTHSGAVIPAKAGIQLNKTGFRVKPGMTIKVKGLSTHYTSSDENPPE